MIRVLHIPSTVGGNPHGLSQHLNLAGVVSKTWTLEQNYLNYPSDRVLWKAHDGMVRREFKRWLAILSAATRHDVIHFNFGTSLAYPVAPRKPSDSSWWMKLGRRLFSGYASLLQILELNLYRLLSRPMFVHYQGDDARQGDFSLTHFRYSIASQVDQNYYNPVSDQFKRKMIQRMARHCDQIYSVNPDLLHVLPPGSRFVPYCHISLDDWLPRYPLPESRQALRIGHAPTHRGVKGTELIRHAVERLRAQGYQMELVLIEGLTHHEAKRQYESLDVFVDQLFAGWYGGLAVEVMALGKPVLVYIREDDLRFIPEAMRKELPFVQASPDGIVDALRGVLEMPRPELHALARRSRAFVERWHDPLKIAAAIKADYELALRRRGKLAA